MRVGSFAFKIEAPELDAPRRGRNNTSMGGGWRLEGDSRGFELLSECPPAIKLRPKKSFLGREFDPVFALVLRLVEHGVGLLNQAVGIAGVIGTDGNPDTGRDRLQPPTLFVFQA